MSAPLQCKHLKVRTIVKALQTDIFRRALPWSRLMIGQEGVIDDLNTSWDERLKALVAVVLLLSVLALPLYPSIWPLAVVAATAVITMNWQFLRHLLDHGGIGVAVGGSLYHQFYYIYSAGVFAWCRSEYHVLRLRVPRTVRACQSDGPIGVNDRDIGAATVRRGRLLRQSRERPAIARLVTARRVEGRHRTSACPLC